MNKITTPIIDKRIEQVSKELRSIKKNDHVKINRLTATKERLYRWKQSIHGEEGEDVGMLCNRDGCQGILTEIYQDGGCSCHTGNAPCGYCERRGMFECDECGYEQDKDW